MCVNVGGSPRPGRKGPARAEMGMACGEVVVVVVCVKFKTRHVLMCGTVKEQQAENA